MNNADDKTKLQIVEKIKGVTNILVTVSKDPTVDELSAAIALSVFLNKLGKHSTAIFSGILPPAITFLEPDKVFENTADSLRDFIIALDKEKADHLRYKVEGDVVKIFITPYRTTITSDDLEFSQGDYNIELVLALGVENQEHLDAALAAQGQMLHDVSVVTFSAGEQSSQLGSVDWRDQGASSLSEMVANLSNSLKSDKIAVDKQIATALLTGIVAATDRFSNTHTTSTVMTIAAQLMAAGADQQLIAAKLQDSHEINSLPSAASTELTEQPANEQSDDSLSILHDDTSGQSSKEAEITDEKQDESPITTEQSVVDSKSDTMLADAPEQEISQESEPEIVPTSTLSPEQSITDTKVDASNAKSETSDEPALGGTLNATSDQAAEDARRELDAQQNKTILSHSYLSGSDQGVQINSNGSPEEETKTVDIFDDAPTVTGEPAASAVGLPMPPPVPDFSTLPPEQLATSPLSTPPVTDAPFVAKHVEQSPLSTLPTSDSNDPSQFKIPV